MVKEGYQFASAPFVLGVLALILGWNWAGGILLFLAAFVLYFFRDPERVPPADPGIVVSPTDGRVVEVVEEALDTRPGHRISIFLAVWNVHVNRAPVAGTIRKLEYKPGKFYAAMRARASLENEQNIFYLETSRGEIVFKQIAGWIARRVVAWKQAGSSVALGERIGMMRFGSRMDVWLPLEVEILVRPGQNVAGGTSILARWK